MRLQEDSLCNVLTMGFSLQGVHNRIPFVEDYNRSPFVEDFNRIPFVED